MHDVVVYSKPECCLCNKIKDQLRKLEKSHPFKCREVNILEDAEVFKKFQEEIPVVFINGRKAFKYRLDEKEFLKRLRAGSRQAVVGSRFPVR
jgi:glutaredoxin